MAIRRFKYRMHHQWATEFSIGRLIPIFLQEVTPGDTWSGRSVGVLRLAPMVRPAFVTLKIHVHFFFVPHRIVWDEFEDFITGQTTPVFPQTVLSQANWQVDTALYKFLGVGDPGVGGQTINAIPGRSYNEVYNEFFRDQEIQIPATNASGTATTQRVSKSKDYLGALRDELQQGAEETIDTSGATLGITAVRDAMQRQRFREKRSRFGERYHDLLAAWGVNAPDSRLDRPEHVAQGRAVMGVSEVLNTSNTDTGDLVGHGIAGVRCNFPKRVFVEHGLLMGFVVVRGRTQLENRLDKLWLNENKDDYFQPELASNATMVTVDNREVWSGAASGNYAYQFRDEWLRSPNDTFAGGMHNATNDGWTGFNANTVLPTVAGLNLADNLGTLFQDQSAGAPAIWSLWDHHIGKRSLVPHRRRT